MTTTDPPAVAKSRTRLPNISMGITIEEAVADSRQGVVLQFGGQARCEQLFTIKHILLQNIDKASNLD